MNKIYFCLIVFLFLSNFSFAQKKVSRSTFEGRHHMLSKDELNSKLNTKDFIETNAPNGNVRNIAEFERNQGVIVANQTYQNINYFGFPDSMIAEMSEEAKVYILVDGINTNELADELSDLDNINMDNIVFIDAAYDSRWTRDFSPWFIAYNNPPQVGIVNFQYNRDRPNDNDVPIALGEFFDLEVFGMNVIHTGGNYMCDGMGKAASTDLVYEESIIEGISDAAVNTRMEEYLGITDYHVVEDPMGEYIKHIDCWGKFLDVDKIIITQVPSNHQQYDEYEAAADYWANQISSYGNKYQVFRVYTGISNDGNGAPYTNSLILNNKVLVPITNYSEWEPYNNDALAVYEQAMPGYEIIGVMEVNYATWESTDALHCRTHEVPDFEMLHINHIPILDTVDYAEQFQISANITSYGGHSLIANMPKLHYSVNSGEYVEYQMENLEDNIYAVWITGIQGGETIEYYIEAEDNSGRNEKHPFIGEPDPHKFIVDENTGVKTHKNSYIKVFPNPATNHISLIVNNLPTGDYEYDIFSIEGNILKKGIINSSGNWQRFIISTDKLPSGIYIIKLHNNRITKSYRFVIQ